MVSVIAITRDMGRLTGGGGEQHASLKYPYTVNYTPSPPFPPIHSISPPPDSRLRPIHSQSPLMRDSFCNGLVGKYLLAGMRDSPVCGGGGSVLLAAIKAGWAGWLIWRVVLEHYLHRGKGGEERVDGSDDSGGIEGVIVFYGGDGWDG